MNWYMLKLEMEQRQRDIEKMARPERHAMQYTRPSRHALGALAGRVAFAGAALGTLLLLIRLTA